MAMITCYQCFARFKPRRVKFKCAFHSSPRLFGPKRLLPGLPSSAICPDDHRVSTFRVCPNCNQDLPHYVGRARQRIVAVSGCSGSGKTVYQWSLLHQLRANLTRETDPFVVAMFEDDRSFGEYGEFHNTIIRDKLVPEFTQVEKQKRGEFKPIIVRLLRPARGYGRNPITNLILYDHGGELIEELQNARYLRYLAHASGLIYLVDPQTHQDVAAEGLNAIINELRSTLSVGKEKPIPLPLALAINKADVSIFLDVFAAYDTSYLVPGYGEGAQFWHKWDSASQTTVRRTSNAVSTWVRENGFNNLVNMAELNFKQVAFFAVSALGEAPDGERLLKVPVPVGVEHPLFWALRTMR